jgi:hypothetical protein
VKLLRRLFGGSIYKVAAAISDHHRQLDGRPESVLNYTVMVIQSNLRNAHQSEKFVDFNTMVVDRRIGNYLDLATGWLWINAPLKSYHWSDARRFENELKRFFDDIGIVEQRFLSGKLAWLPGDE